ncbi:MAG: adenosine-specific kinase [Polyangiales bacterium]
MDLDAIRIAKPDDVNLVLGQAHFVKTVEDLHEAVIQTAPSARFGVAFCEASGVRLVRRSGNDPELVALAAQNAHAIGAGHSFLVLVRETFPVAILNAIKLVPEVCGIYCATANTVDVLVATTGLGRGIVGVIDGEPPLGIEAESDVAERKALLRKLGYKL